MYIRTKDGRIIDTTKYPEHPASWSVQASDYALTIAQSENLAELCDCFVIDWLPTNHKDIFKVDKYSKEVVKSCIGNNKTKVYGAIWCEFGLKYVAKLNSKGELELI